MAWLASLLLAAGAIPHAAYAAPAAQSYTYAECSRADAAALRAIASPHRAVISAETAHITIDETAAPEAIAGLTIANPAASARRSSRG